MMPNKNFIQGIKDEKVLGINLNLLFIENLTPNIIKFITRR